MSKAAVIDSIVAQKPRQGNFNLGNTHRTTLDMGFLIPTYWKEVLPGDYWNFRQENFIRLSPLVAPPMQEVKAKTYVFAVPLRIIWENWTKFIAVQKDADNDIVPPHVMMNITNIAEHSLGDYLGLPLGNHTGWRSALPVAAYYKIFDEWFRNQNIQNDDKFIPLTDGVNAAYETLYTASPLKTNWDKDYFTSALPFAQRGDIVTIPLAQSGSVPVDYGSGGGVWRNVVGGAINTISSTLISDSTGGTSKGADYVGYDPAGSLEVDLQTDAATIVALRNAFKLQEFKEREAIAGTRYVEHLWAHWEVVSSDARQNRPEVIGAFSNYISFSEVLQTSETTVTTPQGNMAGHGIGLNASGNMRYYAEEHMIIMSLTTVKPDTSYSQGIDRAWTRQDRFDYPFPTFQHIGEQEITNKELYFEDPDPDDTWGYGPRYAEWKMTNNMISGEMQTTRAFWHQSRIFSSPTPLNETFIQCDPSARIFATTSGAAQMIATFVHEAYVRRKLSLYSRPMM